MRSTLKQRVKAEKQFGTLLDDEEYPFWFDGFFTVLTNKRLLSMFGKPENLRDLAAIAGEASIFISIAINDVGEIEKARDKQQLGFNVIHEDGSRKFFNWPSAVLGKNLQDLRDHLIRVKSGDFGDDLSLVNSEVGSREGRKADKAKGHFGDAKESLAELKGELAVAKENKEDRKAQRVELVRQAGQVVASERFKLDWITIYSEGFVTVSMGLGLVKSDPEKLIDIWGETDVTKKTGLGRALGAVATSGASLIFASNQRGNIYLTISTDKQIHSIVMENSRVDDVKRLNKIVSAGKSVLKSHFAIEERHSEATRPRDLSEQLERIIKLRDDGILSEEEFTMAKGKILGG
jgi:hypothetical protein